MLNDGRARIRVETSVTRPTSSHSSIGGPFRRTSMSEMPCWFTIHFRRVRGAAIGCARHRQSCYSTSSHLRKPQPLKCSVTLKNGASWAFASTGNQPVASTRRAMILVHLPTESAFPIGLASLGRSALQFVSVWRSARAGLARMRTGGRSAGESRN